MAGFDSVFDSAAFDSQAPGPVGPVLVGTGSLAASLAVTIGDPLVFQSGLGRLHWQVLLSIGTVSFSHRLTGELQITGIEDGARVAQFDLVMLASSDLLGLDQQSVTIDFALTSGGVTTTVRRFTGVVESVEFNAGRRVASISCRDGYQEVIRACRSADAVSRLFSGLDAPSDDLAPWNDAEPDSTNYFETLLNTVPGACAIDSSGQWRAIPWSIGSPATVFDNSHIFNQSLVLRRPDRWSLPSSIRATLIHRFYRLHNIEFQVIWQGPTYFDQGVLGVVLLPKDAIFRAFDILDGWYVKGKLAITEPIQGLHSVNYGGTEYFFTVPDWHAPNCAESFSGAIYRRWYQEVEVTYQVDIPMGGLSSRADVVNGAISSTFDAGKWERPVAADGGFGIWATNTPPTPSILTGYEALPAPWPNPNTGTDYFGEPDVSAVSSAARHVVSKALRSAAQGRRQQTISIQRLLDPRWEIGDVLRVEAYGIAATGQLVEFHDRVDFSSGDAVSTLTLACPDGNSLVTESTVAFTPSIMSQTHIAGGMVLGNHYGGSVDTVYFPEPADSLVGYLTNVGGWSSWYSDTAPTFNQQFRVVMPEISAALRDPIKRTVDMSAVISIAGSGIAVVF